MADRRSPTVVATGFVQAGEQTYTLEQAKQILAERECQGYGHDWTVVQTLNDLVPTGIICCRCGVHHGVVAREG